MSQKKVDEYKKYKANRKKILKKQKRVASLQRFTASVIILAFIAFIGASTYHKWFKKASNSTTAEATTYALSEKEVSEAWDAYYNAEEETTSSETVDSETEASEENASEDASVVEDSSEEITSEADESAENE